MRSAKNAGHTAMKVADANLVAIRARVHAANQANVVHDVCRVRQQFGEFRSTLAVLMEPPNGPQQLLAGVVGKTVIDTTVSSQ